MVKIPTPDTTRSYNPCGQPLNISSGGSTLTYTHDAAHQLLTETQSLAGHPDLTVSHTYGADGWNVIVERPPRKLDREYERRTDLPAGERPARMGPAQARRSRARAGWICPPHSANPQPNTRT